MLTGFTDPSQVAHFSATLILNAVALWLHTSGANLNAVKSPILKTQIRDCFRTDKFLHHVQDKFATSKQTGHIAGYIDLSKCIYSKFLSISDNEILDSSIHDLLKET